MGYSPQSFAVAVLKRLGAPVTPANVQAFTGWERAEGGHWHNSARFNPLNTTQPAAGAGNTGAQGNIKVYRSPQQGIDATVQTLKNGRYANIISAFLKGNDPNAVARAIGASPWGTSAALVSQTIGSTSPPGHIPAAASGGTRTTTTTTGLTADAQQARRTALANFVLGSGDPLTLAKAYAGAGSQTQTTTKVNTTGGTGGAVSGQSGYVNPFGQSLKAPGRVDEGVDPVIQGPIRAIGDARVVNLSHNFYKGQPYIVYQLTSGPHKGRYVYVSELVTPHVAVGQRLRAGDVVATGHGAIETGWAGGPGGSYLPLANRAQGGGYTEGKVTSHGQSFARFLASLGAHAAR